MLLFADSFDHYASADISKKWTAGAGNIGIDATSGRFGTNGLWVVHNTGNVRKAFTSRATYIVGFAFAAAEILTNGITIMSLRDAGTEQVSIRLSSAGGLAISRDGTTLQSSSVPLTVGVHYSIEVKVTIGNSGSWSVRLNQTVVLSGSGDTQNTANATADEVVLGTTVNYDNQQTRMYYDDLWICDDSGSVNNDFLGDIRVQYIAPNGAGGVTQWTPSAGSNYQNVDDAAPNDDTDYNSDATAGDRDTYALGNLTPSAASVKGIQMITHARKDDAGTRTLAPVLRIGGVNYDQASLPNLSSTYQCLPLVVEASPATSSPFTVSEINGMEAGVKLVA